MKIIFFLLFILFFNNTNAEDKYEESLGHGCNPVGINERVIGNKNISYSLKFNNRQYSKELITKLYLKGNRYQLNEKKMSYKPKWIKAEFTINNKSKVCTYKAKVRLTGDMAFHFDLASQTTGIKTGTRHSLMIRLVDANVDSIVSFKLFLPSARGFDNELFAALLYKKLGFLSPRTSNIDIEVNGVLQRYIFQEHINKEFLEFNNRSEGLIIEGDERFGLAPNITFARITNGKWAVQNKISRKISLEAIKQINKSYMLTNNATFMNEKSANKVDPNLIYNDLLFHQFDSNTSKNLGEFYALTYSINGEHGLSKDDSRFYFNSVTGGFEPIYYDTKPNFGLLTKDSVESHVKEHSLSLLEKINLININKFYEDLNYLGSAFNYDEILKKFNFIKNNLQKISSLPNYENEFNSLDNLKTINSFYKNKKIANFSEILDISGFLIKSCDIAFQLCSENNINLDTLRKLFEQRYQMNEDFIVHISGYNKKSEYNYANSIFNLNSRKLDNDTKIYYPHSIDIKINKESMLIELFIKQKNENQVLIKGGQLSKWKIKYHGLDERNDAFDVSRFSQLGLTGCLNFSDIVVDKINIIIDSPKCEDGLHLLRSSGNIDNIEISNTLSDALDIDFGEIKMKTVKINNAGNDCVDFSWGNYSIENALFDKCGDKGVSAGERSNLTVDNIYIKSSYVGIASKDSAIIHINGGSINNFMKAICI